MAQIHHLEVPKESPYVFDRASGTVRQAERKVSASTVGTIQHEGVTYEVAPDGSFYVPDDVAAFFLRMPHWYPGPSPFAPQDETAAPQPETVAPKTSAAKAKEKG